MSPLPAASLAFCLDAQPAEDLAVLVSRGAIANGGKGAPEWLRRALRSNGFVCMSRTPDRLLSVVIGESFLKEVQLPDDVEVERQWAALRLDKAALDPSAALSSFTALCQTVQEAGLALHAVSTPDSEHLLLQSRHLPVMVHALLGVGHAIAPAARVCPSLPSGLVCKNDRCRAVRGAWGLARREKPTGTVTEEYSHGKGPVRLQAGCGLFAEIRIPEAGLRSQASHYGCLEAVGSGGSSSSAVRRHRIVDFQPPTGEDSQVEIEAEGAVLVESGLPKGRCRETWQRVEASHDTVALELISETPGRGVHRQGCWLFCGRLFVRVLGLPRGQGLVASTCCSSLEQLQRLKGEDLIQAEISDHYEAICGTVEKPGVLKITQQALAGAGQVGTALLDVATGAGGAITSLSRSEVVHTLADGTEQRWRVLEWGFNPFSERELSPAASDRSAASASSTAKKKKKKAARSASRSMSISGSAAREKKKKKKDKDKKKKKDKDKAASSDDEDKADKKKKKKDKKEKDRERRGRSSSGSAEKDEKKKKSKKEDRSRSRSKAKKDRSASPEEGGKKKKKDKKDKKDKKASRSRSRSRSGDKKKKKKKEENDDSSAEHGAAKAAELAASADAAGVTAELLAAQAHQQAESRPSNFPITISFRSGQTTARPETKEGADKMVRKSEVHAHHMAAAGALFARASQAKAPKNDPAPAPPPELLAAPPANVSSTTKTPVQASAAGPQPPAEEPSSPSGKATTPAPASGSEGEASKAAATAAEQAPPEQEQEDVPMEEDTPEDTKELPAGFLFPKGYPPPKEDGLPANFLYPHGYPPPPDQPGTLPVHFLYPKGYPPPPETDEPKTVQLTPPGAPVVPGMPPAPPPPPGDPNLLLPPGYPPLTTVDPSAAALLAASPPPPGVPGAASGLLSAASALLMTPPPPPGDPSSAPLVLPQIDPTTGLLLPPPPAAPGAAAGALPPPPPGMPAVTAQPAASDPVGTFLAENKIDPRAGAALRLLPADLQQKVIAEGAVAGTNPSAVLTARMRKFELQAGRVVSTAPGADAGTAPGAMPPLPPPSALLPPGAIGPQPAGAGDAAAPKADPPPPPSLLPPGLSAAQILQLSALAPGALPPPGLPGAPGAAAALAGLPAHLLAGTMPALSLAGKLPALGLPPLPPGLTVPGAPLLHPGAPPPAP